MLLNTVSSTIAGCVLTPKKAKISELTRQVLELIPSFLERPNVLGIGEIGVNRVTRNEIATFIDHVDLAMQYNQLIHIHTPSSGR